MNYRYLFFVLSLWYGTFAAQQILWTKPVAGTNSNGIFCDKNGFIYDYGSIHKYPKNYQLYDYGYPVNDTSGSCLAKYDSSGDLVYFKKWKKTLWINHMVYDQNNHLYACGSFAGQVTIDGQTISSMGKTDGFLAKMDLSGKILWLVSVGGNELDCLTSLTLNKSKNALVVTGGLSNSLHVNNQLVSQGSQRSLLLAEFDLSGALKKQKMVDFLASKNIGNIGLRINCDTAGNYYLLYDREGKSWSSDTTNAPPDGTYLSRLDSSFNFSWDAFMINGSCYYGYGCHRMAQNAAGDSYVPKFCSGKYGGTGEIIKLAAGSGATTWSCTNADGSYTDIISKGNDMFTIGTEGASACPCASNHEGYQVIKKFDAANNLLGETRLKGVRLFNITSGANGNLYVLGTFGGGEAIVGNQVVKNPDPLKSMQWILIALKDVPCSAVNINNKDVHPWAYVNCPDQPQLLEAPKGFLSYKWSNGSTSYSTTANVSGKYWVEVVQPGGCVVSSLPVEVEVVKAVQPDMLAASFQKADNTIEIEWTGTGTHDHEYRLYKQAGSKTELLTTIKDGSYSMFYKDNVTPSVGPVTYYATSIDNCGNESAAENKHTLMRLVYNDQSPVPVLEWNAYKGFEYKKFYIYRGTSAHALSLIDSVDATQTSYTDHAKPAEYYYQVMVQKNTDVRSFSNVRKAWSAGPTALSSFDQQTYIKVFPNPSDGMVSIGLLFVDPMKNIKVSVINLLGQTVYTRRLEVNSDKMLHAVDLRNQHKGIYFVEIEFGDTREVHRLLLQ